MDDKTKADIDAGVPMVIVHWDKNGTTTSQEAYIEYAKPIFRT